MSFDINWEDLVTNESLNDSIRELLDNQFQDLSLPSFIDNISVTKFNLGTRAPEITIRHIGDPFDDFYQDPSDLREVQKSAAQAKTSTYNSSDEESDDDYSGQNELSSISEDHNLNDLENGSKTPTTPHVQSPSPSQRIRQASDSKSLLTGVTNLNYGYNYSMNNIVGLGSFSNTSVHNGRESPTNILNQNPLRQNSSNFLKTMLTTKEKSTARDENDIQLIVDIDYQGDLHIEIKVTLLVNYPSPKFISLPIKLHITALTIHSIATVAYLKDAIYLSFLCDIDDVNSEYFTSSNKQSENTSSHQKANSTIAADIGGNFVDYITGPNNRERIDIIKKVRIESEIGEIENNVLRNVGKVEKFLVDQLRSIIREEIAWPSWVCFDLNDDDDDKSDNDDDDDDNNNENAAEDNTSNSNNY